MRGHSGIRAAAIGLLACASLVAPPGTQAQTRREFPGWNISYTLPSTWQVRQTPGRLHVLASQLEPGALFLAPGFYSDLDDVDADLDVFSQLAGLQGREVEGPKDTTIAGYPAAVASYTGIGRSNQTVQARLVALFTPYGTGFVVLGLSTDRDYLFLKEKVLEVAASVVAQAPVVQHESVAALVGMWVNYLGGRPPTGEQAEGWTRGANDVFEFGSAGDYRWRSSAYLAAEERGDVSDQMLADQHEEGTYTVIAPRALVLKSVNGQRVLALTLAGDRIELAGRTYFRRR